MLHSSHRLTPLTCKENALTSRIHDLCVMDCKQFVVSGSFLGLDGGDRGRSDSNDNRVRVSSPSWQLLGT